MKPRRRNRNEGSIFRRQDGRWTAIVSLGYRNGKRVRKSFYGDTAAAVREQMTAVTHDLHRGLTPSITRQTVAEFLQRWLVESFKPNARPRSYESFEIIIRLHLVPDLGHIRLEKLTPQDVQTLLDQKLKSGLSAQTTTHIRTVLRSALNQALKWNLVARNVAALVDPPRIPRHEIRPLDAADARRFLDTAMKTRLGPVYMLALVSGLRRGELLALKWENVNFDRAELRVVQSLQRVGGKLAAAETKTERSRRTLALPASMVTVLRAHRVRQLEERLAAGPEWKDSGLVFTSRVGTPIEPRNLNRDFERVLKLAQVPRIRFHDLRHSAASLLLSQGVPLRTIMEQLGHSSITLTANTYAHIAPAMMREAADTMETILGG